MFSLLKNHFHLRFFAINKRVSWAYFLRGIPIFFANATSFAVKVILPKKERSETENKELSNKVFICIQIGASTDTQKEDKKFNSVDGIKRIKGKDGYTRFVVGNYSSIKSAKAQLNQLKSNGYKDCFLTAYDGDKKITPQEAEQLIHRSHTE